MHDHGPEFAATFRRYGVGFDQVGDAVSWGEAWLLTQAALRDTSTPLHAAVSGWAFPASMPELLTLAAAVGDPDRVDDVMPWTLGERARAREAAKVTDDDRAAATALLARVSAFRGRDEFPAS